MLKIEREKEEPKKINEKIRKERIKDSEELLKVLAPNKPRTFEKQYVTKENLSSLNNKFLVPRKHLQHLNTSLNKTFSLMKQKGDLRA